MSGGIVSWLLENPEVGWVVVVLYLMWEIRGPKGQIARLVHQLEAIVVVVRALARVHDDIDTKEVDEYLTNNGNEPSDFIERPGTAYSKQSEARPNGGVKFDRFRDDEDEEESAQDQSPEPPENRL